MSTTRKIEGFGANRFGEYQFDVAPDENDGWEPATLIIGGKGYTEAEHEAEFQRRAKAMVLEIFLSCQHFELSGGLPGMLIQPGDVEQIAAKHGIQLP